MISFLSGSPKQTYKFGKAFAKLLKGGEIVALYGNLGSGKTTFIKGLAKGLGIKTKITSPSFLICNQHQLRGEKKLYHFDLYRLKNVSELTELGLAETIQSPKNITAIEWADRAKKLLPKRAVKLEFSHNKHARERILHISV